MLKTLKKLFGGGKKKVEKKVEKKTAAKVAKKAVKAAVKKAVKKTAKPVKKAKVVVAKKAAEKNVASKPIGRVTHYYGGIKVAIIKFSKDIRKGTNVRFAGATTDFAQALESMQYEHKEIAKAPKGKLIGAKVKKRVREGDRVYEYK